MYSNAFFNLFFIVFVTENRNNVAPSSVPIAESNPSTPRRSIIATPKSSQVNLDDFQRKVLNQLFVMNTKLNDLADFVYTHQPKNTYSDNVENVSKVPEEIQQLFPLKNDCNMTKIEEYLTEVNNRYKMVHAWFVQI